MSQEDLRWWFCFHHLRCAHLRVGPNTTGDAISNISAGVCGVSFYALMSFINHEWTSPDRDKTLSDAVVNSCLHLFVVKAAAMHISFCIFTIDVRWWAIHFCHPGKWSRVVSHFDTSNIYIIQPTRLLIFAAWRSFHSVRVLDEKLQP